MPPTIPTRVAEHSLVGMVIGITKFILDQEGQLSESDDGM